MPSTAPRCPAHRLGLALLLALASGGASANEWINPGTGDWFTGSNWSDGIAPTTDFAIADIYNGGQAWVVGPGAEADFVEVGYAGSATGNVFVDGAGVLTAHDSLDIGQGTVTARSGGHILVSALPGLGGGNLRVSAPGNLVIDSVGSTVSTGDLSVSGMVNVRNGGQLVSRYETYLYGSIGVDGPGTLFQSNLIEMVGSSSILAVVNGGETDVGRIDFFGGGTVDVSGPGSTLNLTSTSGGMWGTRSAGYIGIGAGLLISHNANILGDGFTPSGDPNAQVRISGFNSTWFSFGTLSIGGGPLSPYPATGVLVVDSGGTLFSEGASLGNGAGSYGKALVYGAGSAWFASGDLIVGSQATGIVEITNGGRVSSTRGFIGNEAGSSGDVSLSGVGSSWNVNGPLVIGSQGNGQLNVADHAVVGVGGSALVGSFAGSQGVVDVDGAGSSFNVLAAGSSLNIGGSPLGAGGNGSVEVSDGGTVNTRQTNLYRTGSLSLADDAHFHGHITSDGGRIGTLGTNTLDSDITLKAGGVFVNTSRTDSLATFTGNIDGSGGLVKYAFLGYGGGTLVLTGANTYTGATRVDIGTLIVNGSGVSATTVTKGTLGGTGAIAAPVTIGDGSGVADAVLAPGQGIGRLRTGDVAFASDGAFAFQIDSAAGTADQLAVTGGVSIADGAQFEFDDLTNAMLAMGTQFVAIDNDGLDAIAGHFANLIDGSVFDFGMNEFRASYEGGTGNDLVLTVLSGSITPPSGGTVPEPSVPLLMGVGAVALAVRQRRHAVPRRPN